MWVVLVGLLIFREGIWIETTQEDFADGIYERNIYASHRNGGAVEFVFKYDLDRNGYIDLFTAGHYGDNVYIYWGDADGYRPDRRRAFPISGGGNCDAADLNRDGYPDFVVAPNRCKFIRIYWGTSTGPDPYNYQEFPLPDYKDEACFVADLNKDGYLDIVIAAYDASNFIIYWGSKEGYNPNNSTLLPSDWSCHNIEVADFNKDQWLDLCIVNMHGGYNCIFWGSENGFEDTTMLQSFDWDAHGLSVADLDNNGYLDLIFTGCRGFQEAFIYWGDSSGFNRSDTLHTDQCYGGSSVGDLNKDGYLDIVFHRGWQPGVSLTPCIYWGSESGYSDTNRTFFGFPIEGSGGTVADFNQDGDLDIFCNSYSTGNSYVYWGPDFTTYTALPTDRDHHGMFREVGNVYDRGYYEDYLSSIYDGGAVTYWRRLSWDDSLPPGAGIKLFVRTGNTPQPDTSWSGWVEIPNGGGIPASLRARYIQYKAHLTYTNPAYLPVLWEVRVEYGSGVGVEIMPSQVDTVLPGEVKDYGFDVTNLGDSIDVVDLLITDTLSWSYSALDSVGNPLGDHNGNGYPDLVIDSLDTVRFLLRVQVPETVLYGVVDWFELIARSSRDTTVMDSADLELVVGLAPSVVIYPDRYDSARTGEVVEYLLYVGNSGNGVDTVDLRNFGTRPGWVVIYLDSVYQPLKDHNHNGWVDIPGLSAYGGLDSFRFWVRVPDSEALYVTDTTVVRAYSGYDSVVWDSVVVRTYVYGRRVLVIDSSQVDSVDPGAEVRYGLEARNLGDKGDTVELFSRHTGSGWQVIFYDSLGNPIQDLGYLGPNERVSFSAGVRAPVGALAGEVDTSIVYGRFVSDTTIYDSVLLWTRVKLKPGLSLYPDQVDTGGPGDTVDISFYVQNLGNGSDYCDFVVVSKYPVVLLDSLGAMLSDHNGNGKPDILLGYGEVVRVVSRVYIPAGAVVGEADTVVVTGSSGYDPEVSDQVVLVVNVVGVMINFAVVPDTSGRVEAGRSISYGMRLEYEGNVDDVIDLEVVGIEEGWGVSLVDSSGVALVDHDHDGLVDFGSVTTGVYRFGLVVTPPRWRGLVGEIYRTYLDTVVVYGYGSRVSKSDSAVVVTVMVPPVDIHNYPNPFAGGTSFIFSLSDDGVVNLRVYNRAGELIRELVKNRRYELGVYRVSWDGRNRYGRRCAPGVYLYLFEFKHKGKLDRIMKKLLIRGK